MEKNWTIFTKTICTKERAFVQKYGKQFSPKILTVKRDIFDKNLEKWRIITKKWTFFTKIWRKSEEFLSKILKVGPRGFAKRFIHFNWYPNFLMFH